MFRCFKYTIIIFRRGKPSFKVQLVLQEEKRFKGRTGEDKTLHFSKNLTVYGIINWTGDGKRLAVLKVTDAITNQALGRIQARRADAVSSIHFIIYAMWS